MKTWKGGLPFIESQIVTVNVGAKCSKFVFSLAETLRKGEIVLHIDFGWKS